MRYVLAVAEKQSFTKGAEKCFVAQSALSHQIASLERELGVPLFARTSRRVRLTAAGEAFLPAARECLRAADRAKAEATSAEGLVQGHLQIGVIPTVAAISLPEVITAFRQQYPDVRVSLHTAPSNQLMALVRDHKLDIAFLGLPESDQPTGVTSHELARDPLVATVAPTHPLAHLTEVSLQRLSEETFVDFPAHSPGRTQSDQAFQAAGLTRDVAFEVTTGELMGGIIAQRLAIGLLPSTFAVTMPQLTTVPVIDGPKRVEYVAWSDFSPTPAARAFLTEINIDVSG